MQSLSRDEGGKGGSGESEQGSESSFGEDKRIFRKGRGSQPKGSEFFRETPKEIGEGAQ